MPDTESEKKQENYTRYFHTEQIIMKKDLTSPHIIHAKSFTSRQFTLKQNVMMKINNLEFPFALRLE